jgi:hypothetical protein
LAILAELLVGCVGVDTALFSIQQARLDIVVFAIRNIRK